MWLKTYKSKSYKRWIACKSSAKRDWFNSKL